MSSAAVGSGYIRVGWEGIRRGGSPLPSAQDLEQSREGLGQCANSEKGLRKERVVGLPEACSLGDFFFFFFLLCHSEGDLLQTVWTQDSDLYALYLGRRPHISRPSLNMLWIHSPCHFMWKPFYKEEDSLLRGPHLGLIGHPALSLQY